MTGLVNKFWLLIILYTGYEVYMAYEAHGEKLIAEERRVPQIKKQIKKAEKEKAQLKQYFEDIEEAKKRIEKVAQEVERLQRQFPLEISDTENLELISSIAESLNIKNIFLKPGTEQSKDFYISKLYNVKAEGTFLQFVIFLEKIAEAERLMNIRDISLHALKRKQKGRFQLIQGEVNIETYKYNPNFREDRGIESISKKFVDKNPKKKKKKKKRKRKK